MRSLLVAVKTTLILWSMTSSLAAQDKYAVVVGVEIYDPGTFENLEFADEDAERLGKAFKAIGFQTTVVTRHSESAKLKPSNAENIITTIKTRSKSCGANDTLVVSLSGHGVQFEDEPDLESGIKETYFCPENADLDDKSTLIPIS